MNTNNEHEKINDMVSELAKLRNERDKLQHQKTEMTNAFFESQPYTNTIDKLNDVENKTKEIEDRLRELQIIRYKYDNNKSIHPALGVRVYKILKYPELSAITWCIKSDFLAGIQLNKRMFEKHARAVLQTMPLEFVQVVEEPSATIATDLTKYMEFAT